MKEWTDELSVTCTAKRRTGQLSLFACADDLLVAVLSSWSSADDTHTVSILFGDPIQLGRALGLE